MKGCRPSSIDSLNIRVVKVPPIHGPGPDLGDGDLLDLGVLGAGPESSQHPGQVVHHGQVSQAEDVNSLLESCRCRGSVS